ncbi:MAG: SHOCT domain-containing protein [Burkholderiales bacterium]
MAHEHSLSSIPNGRYARGEIGKEEFDRMKRDLTGG